MPVSFCNFQFFKTMNSLTWAAVIPAYNAAGTIPGVVEGVKAHLSLDRILIVDDGSTDGTADAVRKSGAQLLHKEVNCGKGRALRDGFRHVLVHNPDWILCLDADGQHDPAAIPAFQQAAGYGQFDMIVGNRRRDQEGMPLNRRFSNFMSSGLLSLRTGMKLPDVQCGYRAIKADVLRQMNLQAQKYEIEAEMIIEAWRQGCTIGWVEIPTLYSGEPSFIRKTPETIRFIKLIIRTFYE